MSIKLQRGYDPTAPNKNESKPAGHSNLLGRANGSQNYNTHHQDSKSLDIYADGLSNGEDAYEMQYEDDGEFYDEDEIDEDELEQQEVANQHNQKQKEMQEAYMQKKAKGNNQKVPQNHNQVPQLDDLKCEEQQIMDNDTANQYSNEDFIIDQMQDGQDDQYDKPDFIPVVTKKQPGNKRAVVSDLQVKNAPKGAGQKIDILTSQPHIDLKQEEGEQSNGEDEVQQPIQTSSPPKNDKTGKKAGIKDALNEAKMSNEGVMKKISQAELNLKPHERKIGQYILGKTIGEGTFGKVKIGTHILTKARVAVKILEKSKIVDVADVERVSREIHILKIVQHPHVVQLYEIIETPKKLYLVMEYASGGELFDYIVKHQRVQEKEACKFFQQLLSGIEYTSRLNIVHRDLKPENLLLDFDKSIKIVDFGLSNTYKKGELLKTACGSPCYAAPEMIAGKKYNGTNVDIWSCGVILFALICGYLPFEDPNTSNLYKKILNADFQTPNYVSDDAKDLFHCILNTDPEKRYTIEQIRKHPWFNLVECEATFKGIQVGTDPVPIDNNILDSLKEDFDIDPKYAKKCLQANKHNHISASYYLRLKEILKRGDKSVADVRSPSYNPQLFVQSQKVVKREKIHTHKLENTSMQHESQIELKDESETQSPKTSQQVSKKQQQLEDANKAAQDAQLDQDSKDNLKKTIDAQDTDKEKNDETGTPREKTEKREPRTKSTQPMKLRKIADGLLEFERYADRKKRLENIQKRQEAQDRIKNMNLGLSQNQIADDLLSNGGGLSLLRRGLSPVNGDGNTIDGHEILSVDGDPNGMFSLERQTYQDYAPRDNSPSLSPHSIRQNAQRGNMSTKYGNFLYQVDAKQFPGSQMTKNHPGKASDQFQFNLLSNELQLQALKQQAANNQNALLNIQQINTKQMHKQLKQLQVHQKKNEKTKNGAKNNQEVVLKNMANNGQYTGGISNQNQQQMAQLAKIQHLQQNYQKQLNKKNNTGQNFSTIQTAFDTQPTLMMNHTLGFNNSGVSGKSKRSAMIQQMNNNNISAQSQINSQMQGGAAHRYAPSNFSMNPTFNTIQQTGMPNSTISGGATIINSNINNANNTHSTFINNVTAMQNGSSLGIQNSAAYNKSGRKRRGANATVTGSGSYGPGGGIFSPKHLPSNSFGFGFNGSNQFTNMTTPQNQVQRMQKNPLFTIDAQGGTSAMYPNNTSQTNQQSNLSNQLMQSLQTMQHQNDYSQHEGSQQQPSGVMNSLILGSKQNSVPPQHQANTISYSGEGNAMNTTQPMQSQNSNNALFKRRRDHSKTNKNQNKSAQKYAQYGTIQQNEMPGGAKKNSSKINLSMNNSNKPPLNFADGKNVAQNSQKKIQKNSRNSNKTTRTNQNKSLQASASGNKNKSNISMKRIIETGQNLANMNLNLNLNHATAASTKNSNLFSPVAGGPELNSLPLSPQQQQQLRMFQQQTIQDQQNNLNMIQHQLQLKQQQKEQIQNKMLNTTNDFDYKSGVNQKKVSKGAKSVTKQLDNNINNSFTGGSQSNQMNAANMAYTGQSYNNKQNQNNLIGFQSNQQQQNKKVNVTLNSSLLAQNYAPHLLLQNFHGNGYPPSQQNNAKHGPGMAVPNMTNYAMSPQSMYSPNLMSPLNNSMNQGGTKQYTQSQTPNNQQLSQQQNNKQKHIRRKTPQIGNNQQQQYFTQGNQQSQISNHTQQQVTNENAVPRQTHNSPGNPKTTKMNNMNNQIQYNNNQQQYMVQQQDYDYQPQYPLSTKNSNPPYNGMIAPLTSQNTSASFGRPSNSVTPQIPQNQIRMIDQSDMNQQLQNTNSPNGVLQNLQLDNSNIDYLEEVDVSNNTIANINHQLSEVRSGSSQQHQQPINQANQQKKKTRVQKKKSINQGF